MDYGAFVDMSLYIVRFLPPSHAYLSIIPLHYSAIWRRVRAKVSDSWLIMSTTTPLAPFRLWMVTSLRRMATNHSKYLSRRPSGNKIMAFSIRRQGHLFHASPSSYSHFESYWLLFIVNFYQLVLSDTPANTPHLCPNAGFAIFLLRLGPNELW